MKTLNLIETMYRAADGTVPLLQRHLERLSQSADTLDMVCDKEAINAAVRALRDRGSPMRLRLELSPDGQWQLDTSAFTEEAPDRIWRLRIAETRLRSTDALLRHKTTQRRQYDLARSEFAPEAADEVLLLNERGEICEGTITSLFLRPQGEQTLITPALDCGLLQGVLRQKLLDCGKAREAMLRPEDMRETDCLFVGNALRGLLSARLVGQDAAGPKA